MTWNLHAMRDLNRADQLGGLGPRVERKPEAAPDAPEPVGVYEGPDGKMRTNLPLPPGPATPPIWPFPTQPAGDVPDGAMWREKGGPLFFRWDSVNDRAEVNSSGDKLGWLPGEAEFKRRDFDNTSLFEPIDTTTEEPGGFLRPLKVGDRVRVLKFSPRVCVVAHHVSSWAGDLALRTTDGATLRYIHEGEVWERVA